MRTNKMGFTLIELMIAIAVIAVLAAVVYPSYLSQIRKSGRSDAKVALSDAAQRLQRCFTTTSTYKPAAGTCTVVDSLTGSSGVSSTKGDYVVKLVNDTSYTATTYTLQATPATGSRQVQDTSCAKFTLTHTGVRGATNSSSVDTTSSCW